MSTTQQAILLALASGPLHGYGIMLQVLSDAPDHHKLSPATLYTAIKKLREAGTIEEVPFGSAQRRKNYRLTKKGWDTLASNLRQAETAVRIGKLRQVL